MDVQLLDRDRNGEQVFLDAIGRFDLLPVCEGMVLTHDKPMNGSVFLSAVPYCFHHRVSSRVRDCSEDCSKDCRLRL